MSSSPPSQPVPDVGSDLIVDRAPADPAVEAVLPVDPAVARTASDRRAPAITVPVATKKVVVAHAMVAARGRTTVARPAAVVDLAAKANLR